MNHIRKFNESEKNINDEVKDILKSIIFDEQRPKASTVSVYDALNKSVGGIYRRTNDLSEKADKLIAYFCKNRNVEKFIHSINMELGLSSKTEKELKIELSKI